MRPRLQSAKFDPFRLPKFDPFRLPPDFSWERTSPAICQSNARYDMQPRTTLGHIGEIGAIALVMHTAISCSTPTKPDHTIGQAIQARENAVRPEGPIPDRIVQPFLSETIPLSRALLTYRGRMGEWPRDEAVLAAFLAGSPYPEASADLRKVEQYEIQLVGQEPRLKAIAKPKDRDAPMIEIDLAQQGSGGPR